jgi:hypothetical protein
VPSKLRLVIVEFMSSPCNSYFPINPS